MATQKDHDQHDQDADAPDVDEPTGQVRPFADVIRSLRRGRTHDELSVNLQELAAAVLETRKGGTIVYTLKMSPKKGSEHQVEIVDDVKVKLPTNDREASLWFVDDEHNLSRDDPNQPQLPMRSV